MDQPTSANNGDDFTADILGTFAASRGASQPETEAAQAPKTADMWSSDIPSPNPFYIALHLLDTDHNRNQFANFRAWRGQWYRHADAHWEPVPSETLIDRLWARLGPAKYTNAKGEMTAYNPTEKKLKDVLSALASLLRVPHDTDAPVMWDGLQYEAQPWNGISFTNGLLDLDTMELSDHTQDLFNLDSRPFAYDPEAVCPRWEQFLTEAWGDDTDSINLLQEWFGYVLAGRNDQEKILQIKGPTRSGKGTAMSVLKGLVGVASVAEMGLDMLKDNNGLHSVIGKTLLLIPDAEQESKLRGAAVERLKSISGNDSLTVTRKYKDNWEGRLAARITITANKLPSFHDTTGALGHRFLTLVMSRSFLGREDTGLKAALAKELPGIFNWAMAGLRRLEARGHFVQPDSAADAMQLQRDIAAPMLSFIEEQCVIDPGASMLKTEFRLAWAEYCEENNIQRGFNSTAKITQELTDAVPGVETSKREPTGKRRWLYGGIRLKTPDELRR